MGRRHLSRRSFLGRSTAAIGAAGLLAGRSISAMGAVSRPPRMKFGLNLLLYTGDFPRSKLDLIAKVAEMGFEGVEIPIGNLEVVDAAATRRAVERAGLGVTTCSFLTEQTNIISSDPAVRRAGVERIRRSVELTAEIGAKIFCGPMYAALGYLPGRGRTADEWKWCVECLRVCGEHAAKAGVVIALEPLNRFETYFINTAADVNALVRQIGHPNVRVHLDTFHCNIEEKDTGAAIRATGANLAHFHASESDRGTPGTGQVHWKEAFAALKEINYSGWVVIESFAKGIADLCAAAAIWRDIYESADGLAREGLAFLRALARVA